ncbi:MAG: hypothetical protein ACI3VS_05500, partial [Evtepia sp.]
KKQLFFGPPAGSSEKCKKSFRLWEKALPFPTGEAAACCAHSLSAKGEQFAHLQSEKYFSRRTRRREK